MEAKKGIVSIVGAGPGDPELLTVKALKRIQNAEVILYDALIDARIIAQFPKSADCIYVGKRAEDGTCQDVRQKNIYELYLQFAHKNLHVVRLKSGDPLIFARGVEEIRFLQEQHIIYEIIPGISAGLAGAAIFGIPLTERAVAPSLLLSSGVLLSEGLAHLKPSIALLKEGSAIIIYMSIKRMVEIKQYLLQQGISIQTGMVILSRISTPDQKKWVGTLNDVEVFLADGIPSPSLVILGKNVHTLY